MTEALERRLPWLFVALGLPLALFFAIVVPPGHAPDERAHAVRAGSLIHGQWIGGRAVIPHPADGRPVVAAGVDADPAFGNALFFPYERPVTRALWDARAAVPWAGRLQFWEAPGSAVNPPTFYLGASATVAILQRLGVRPFPAIRAARIVNALIFVAIGLLALRLARRGRRLMLAVLLTPMSLFVAGSLNPDGPLIACAMLAAALVTRIEATGGATRWSAAALLACVIAARPPYLPLAAVMAVPRGSRRARVGAVLLALAPGLVWWVLVARLTWTPFWRFPYHGGPYWHGDPAQLFRSTDPAAQLRVLLDTPRLLISLPWGGFRHLRELWMSMIGVLGHLDLALPRWLYWSWTLALASALAADGLAGDVDPAVTSVASRVVPVACVLACLYGIAIAQYLSWSDVGAAAIAGVQGRYFLPLFGMLALAMPLARGRWPGAATARALGLMLPIAAAMGTFFTLMRIIDWYYLR